MGDSKPDWENFAKAILTEWPTGDLEGSVLFDLSLEYGMIQEVPGGYNSDHHIDAEGICPEEGDPWYEYTFRGEAGPGLYSIADMNKRIEELQARVAELEAANRGLVRLNETTEARAEAAEALLSEAVKAGMLEGAKLIAPKGEQPDVDPSNMGDVQDEAFWLADMNAATRLRTLADNPEAIARIVAQLKEGRG